ncbi:MAG: hypothetical protein Tsb002_25800 [Wenzhouxiangellaceae bacterium]
MRFQQSMRTILASITITSAAMVYAAEPADTFSRANCFNNESITYNYFDPPEWRAVFSWHWDKRVNAWVHYVTENPLAYCDAVTCWHHFTLQTRHAGVHGMFLSSEPNPDGTMLPGLNGMHWVVSGIHTTIVPGVTYFQQGTSASDCNLHFDQIY